MEEYKKDEKKRREVLIEYISALESSCEDEAAEQRKKLTEDFVYQLPWVAAAAYKNMVGARWLRHLLAIMGKAENNQVLVGILEREKAKEMKAALQANFNESGIRHLIEVWTIEQKREFIKTLETVIAALVAP